MASRRFVSVRVFQSRGDFVERLADADDFVRPGVAARPFDGRFEADVIAMVLT